MARAFIASVPLGAVLVAAVIVPVAVTPGTFGFQSWPSSHGGQVTDRPVEDVPDHVAVVKTRSHRHGSTRIVVSGAKPHRQHTPPATAPDRETVNLVMTPDRSGSGRGGSDGRSPGNGGSHGSGPGSSSPTPATPGTPSTPASEPEPQQPSPVPDPGQIADGGAPPVLRPEPEPTPEPPPSPVTPVVPVAPVVPVVPVVPSPPAPGEDSHHGDHGDRRRGPVRDLLHGLGIAREHGLGFGHGRDDG